MLLHQCVVFCVAALGHHCFSWQYLLQRWLLSAVVPLRWCRFQQWDFTMQLGVLWAACPAVAAQMSARHRRVGARPNIRRVYVDVWMRRRWHERFSSATHRHASRMSGTLGKWSHCRSCCFDMRSSRALWGLLPAPQQQWVVYFCWCNSFVAPYCCSAVAASILHYWSSSQAMLTWII